MTDEQRAARGPDPWGVKIREVMDHKDRFSMADVLDALGIPRENVNELTRKRIGDFIKSDHRFCATEWENLFPGHAP
jgi:hypothetical protein